MDVNSIKNRKDGCSEGRLIVSLLEVNYVVNDGMVDNNGFSGFYLVVILLQEEHEGSEPVMREMLAELIWIIQ